MAAPVFGPPGGRRGPLPGQKSMLIFRSSRRQLNIISIVRRWARKLLIPRRLRVFGIAAGGGCGGSRGIRSVRARGGLDIHRGRNVLSIRLPVTHPAEDDQ